MLSLSLCLSLSFALPIRCNPSIFPSYLPNRLLTTCNTNENNKPLPESRLNPVHHLRTGGSHRTGFMDVIVSHWASAGPSSPPLPPLSPPPLPSLSTLLDPINRLVECGNVADADAHLRHLIQESLRKIPPIAAGRSGAVPVRIGLRNFECSRWKLPCNPVRGVASSSTGRSESRGRSGRREGKGRGGAILPATSRRFVPIN